ncbi:MAG: TIGR03905 family TSCPD domain-containing protein [Eubacterium sp.]|nr:TIGR03905 family TSCPD domain-containing protein [Eubacterium sp.]
MYQYRTKGTCAREIQFDVTDNKVHDIRFIGGCMGNTQGVSLLAEGRDIDELIGLLQGVDCGGRGTSCPDQLALALTAYKQQIQ